MKTIAQRWEELRVAIMPQGVSELQVMEMRRAFYAGFQACLKATEDMADESGDDDLKGVLMIQALHNESQAFVVEIMAGRA